ncbi:ComEC/Rec2 family competence protein [Pseudomonas sp. 210_17 TE3656]
MAPTEQLGASDRLVVIQHKEEVRMDVTMIQHPVGQGGMFSGQLQSGNATLRWVYDCGSNQQDRLKEEILTVAAQGPIDLLFLSHLDSDHVNGVDRLLAATTVGEVVLPYLNAADYAVAIIRDLATGALSGTFLEFVVDPAKWLIGRGVGTVSFVRTVDRSQSLSEWRLPEPGREEPRPGETGSINTKWPPSAVKRRSVKNGIAQDIAAGAAISIDVNGSQLDWLLAPYAHKPSRSRMQAFIEALKAKFGGRLTRSAIVRHARDEKGRALLKECYRTLWVGTNSISMSLYAGPQQRPMITRLQLPFSLLTRPHTRSPLEIGWLATGDAELAYQGRLLALLNHFVALRDRVGVLVLPHHGSKRNFSQRLIRGFPNLHACVAAAGPNSYEHPHPSVYEQVISTLGEHAWHHVSEQPDSGFGLRASL